MFIFALVLLLIIAVLLVLVVLVQNSKGGGLSGFAGAGASQLMGVKSTTDILEKITWGLVAALMLITLSTNFMVDRTEQQQGIIQPSKNVEKAMEQGSLPSMQPQQQQAAPADQQPQPAPQGN
ncbi:MAG: preprotein translocase subunit SecG [Cytophagales bacterium]|nr:preprotein translocase subunit SecG [Cytophagales bacterium]